MKKIIVCILLLLLTSNIFSQNRTPGESLSTHEYLERSERQSKVGTILLVSGIAFVAASYMIPKGELVNNCEFPFEGSICYDEYRNDGIKNTFLLAGTLSAVSSIPFYIASGKNRRRAASLGLSTQKTIHLNNQILVSTSAPVLRLTVDF